MSYQIKSILYASDPTPRSPAVFRHAVGIAMQFGAKLHAVTVSPPSSSIIPHEEFITREKLSEIREAGHQRAKALLKARIDTFAQANPEMDVSRILASVRALEGEPAARILDTAGAVLADMIVMGSRGHGAIGELLIGSVAHKMTMKADVAVILVPIDR